MTLRIDHQMPHWNQPPEHATSWGTPPARTFNETDLALYREEQALYDQAELERASRPEAHHPDESEEDEGECLEVEDAGEKWDRLAREMAERMKAERAAQAARKEAEAAKEAARQEEEKKAATAREARAEASPDSSPLAAALEAVSRLAAVARCPDGADPGEFGSLGRQVKYDIETFRSSIRSEGRSGIYSRGAADADHVLRYALAKAASPDKEYTDWRDSAALRYAQHPDWYDALLGGLVLAVRDGVRRRNADAAYHRGTNATAAQDWSVYREGLRRRREAGARGLSTGLPALDAALWGGLRGVTFLAGADGAGKTALTTSFVLTALRRHPEAAALYYSMELSKTVVLDRLLCAEAGVGYRALLSGDLSADEERLLGEAEARLLADVLPRLHVEDRQSLGGPAGLTSQRAIARRASLLRETGAERCLFGFDSFQHIRPPGVDPTSLAADHHRLEMLKEIQDATVSVTWPQGGPLLVVSEVRKDADPHDLEMADLLGSTHLKHAPDVAMFLQDGDAGRAGPDGAVPRVLSIRKGREGVEHASIPLWFDYRHYRFSEQAATPPTTTTPTTTTPTTGGRKLDVGRKGEVTPWTATR